jgi:hypothetical protein
LRKEDRHTELSCIGGRTTTTHQDLVNEWVYWTDGLTAQGFMDCNWSEGHSIIGAAVDAYVAESPGLNRAGAGLSAEELLDEPMLYLHLHPQWRRSVIT